jgi:hypothetical protein
VNEEMLKIAYQQGLEKALDEAGMDKEALIGSMLGRGAMALGKGLFGASKLVGKGALKGGKGLWRGASKVVPGGGDTLAFGAFGGGLGALTAEPGSRLQGFAKGLGAGLIGGAGWHYGGQAAKGALGSLAKSKMLGSKAPAFAGRMQKVLGVGSKANKAAGPMSFRGILGSQGTGGLESAKMLGTKAMVAVPTLGAAWGLSGAAEDAASKYIPALRHEGMGSYADVPRYMGVARDVLRAPRMGLTPPGSSTGTFPGARTW